MTHAASKIERDDKKALSHNEEDVSDRIILFENFQHDGLMFIFL